MPIRADAEHFIEWMDRARWIAAVAMLCFASVTGIAQTEAPQVKVTTGMVQLADSDVEYFTRGEGEAIILLPGGTLTVGYLDGLANTLATGLLGSISADPERVQAPPRALPFRPWQMMSPG